jgi:hypothetical protein
MSPEAQKLFDESVAEARRLAREHPTFVAITVPGAVRLALRFQIIWLFQTIPDEDHEILTNISLLRISTFKTLNFDDKVLSPSEQEELRSDSEEFFMDAVNLVLKSEWVQALNPVQKEILESEFLKIPFLETP